MTMRAVVSLLAYIKNEYPAVLPVTVLLMIAARFGADPSFANVEPDSTVPDRLKFPVIVMFGAARIVTGSLMSKDADVAVEYIPIPNFS